MLNNNLYNLMMQMTVEHLSLWRIKKHYLKDAKNKDEKKFWNELAKAKEKTLKELNALVKKEMK